MNTHAKAAPVNKSRSNAPAATAGKAGANPVQKKENKTGLPDRLKAGLENLSNHSMDDVRVHYHSPKPAQLQAHAYAQGSDIHLAPGQEKHLPHEAWHVVQQKQGRVKPTMQLKGQVSVNDDAGLESEADRMGRMALHTTESPKETLTNPGSYAGVAQRYHIQDTTEGIFLAQEEREKEDGEKTFLSPEKGKANLQVKGSSRLRVADTGQMAIEDGGSKREAKMFYATEAIQKASNKVLQQIGSPIRLGINTSAAIEVLSKTGESHVLFAMYPIDVMKKKLGDEVQIPELCNEAGPHVLNTKMDMALKPRLSRTGWTKNMQNENSNDTVVRLLNHFKRRKEKKDLETEYGSYWKTNWLRALANPLAKKLTNTRHDRENRRLAGYDHVIQNPESEPINSIWNRFGNDGAGFVDAYAEAVNSEEGQELIESAGINQYIDPKVGEMLSIRPVSIPQDERKDGDDTYIRDRVTDNEIKNPFPYHYASVIAKSGSDYITMENYARREKAPLDDPSKDARFFFQMYGPKQQSFHEKQKNDYPGAMTLVYGKQPNGAKVPEYDTDTPQFEEMQKVYNHKMNRYMR